MLKSSTGTEYMKNIFKKFKIYGFKRFMIFAFIDIKNKVLLQWIKHSYSQHGEDLVIDKFLGYKKKGFYVDIGAYDPDRFSNTKRFYLKGWRGINIEPDSINYSRFQSKRSRDINLNIGIGAANKPLLFYVFIPDTLSTFSQDEAKNYMMQGYQLVKKINVPVKRLTDVFKKSLPKNTIDFMSIDTEGFEMEVLKNNDWRKYRPRLMCIETSHHNMSPKEYKQKKILENYINKIGYKKVFTNNVNSLYLDEKK